MRKRVAFCAVAAALILIGVLPVVRYLDAPPISAGKALPPGKVKPQLVSNWDSAVLLAPNGSLWEWGGTLLSSAFAAGSGTTLMLGKDGKLWGWGKRLGVENPGAARKKIRSWLGSMAWQFPALGFLIRPNRDETPFLLWELPAEARRSRGSGEKGSTNQI